MLPTSRELRHIILGERWGKAAFEALGFSPHLTAVERRDRQGQSLLSTLLFDSGFRSEKQLRQPRATAFRPSCARETNAVDFFEPFRFRLFLITLLNGGLNLHHRSQKSPSA